MFTPHLAENYFRTLQIFPWPGHEYSTFNLFYEVLIIFVCATNFWHAPSLFEMDLAILMVSCLSYKDLWLSMYFHFPHSTCNSASSIASSALTTFGFFATKICCCYWFFSIDSPLLCTTKAALSSIHTQILCCTIDNNNNVSLLHCCPFVIYHSKQSPHICWKAHSLHSPAHTQPTTPEIQTCNMRNVADFVCGCVCLLTKSSCYWAFAVNTPGASTSSICRIMQSTLIYLHVLLLLLLYSCVHRHCVVSAGSVLLPSFYSTHRDAP